MGMDWLEEVLLKLPEEDQYATVSQVLLAVQAGPWQGHGRAMAAMFGSVSFLELRAEIEQAMQIVDRSKAEKLGVS